ncbi:histidine phosphatase family protein [Nodosilinea sp. FACHB-131]|uniref:histidine phosphatase family protein n=1 Tax=Cyanophyceae TaxID=3028117 RepID=UPI001685F7C3|nr:histidine phosphatase family protein [Nodosilinea sp. FACHB-131]MBD1877003.1 histidine phosphatase family protein [Nodosilinea sp. FACHB-131]
MLRTLNLPKLLLIRHGQTALNVEGRVHSQQDSAGLDEIGRWQASRLVEVCRGYGVRSLLSSPEARALETAQIVGDALVVPLQCSEALCERNWGQWSGEPWQQIHERLKSMSLEERFTFVPPGGESWQQMEQRLMGCVEVWRGVSESIAVVAHGGLLRALIPLLLNEPRESSFRYDLDNASVSVFGVAAEGFEVMGLNDVGHLEGGG